MLLNALVHRTYMGAPVQIRVFDDRLSIWNEGTLPQGLSLDDLRKEHNSRPRNPNIADACFKAGYIDTWGRGILKIINSCKEAELPDPEINEMDGGLQVVLYKNAGGQDGSQVSSQDGSQVYDITKRQQEVLDYIIANPTISRKQLSEKLNINESAVQKHIEALKKKEKIERDSATTGYWKVK